MNVRLPNGKVLRNVPNGTGKAAIMNAAVRAGLATYKDFFPQDPTEGMSGLEKFRAGIGRGLVRTARSVGNMVGLVDDETINDADERDRALMGTGAGRAGNFVGEVTATLPVGGLAGAGARAVAARALPRALAALAPAVAEGAATGAVLADPGKRLQGAMSGAVVGGGVGGTASLIGKGLKRAAQGLPRSARGQALLDEGVPLTPGQAAAEGSLVQRAEDVMAKTPGIGSGVRKLRNAADDANLRELLDELAPTTGQMSLKDIAAAALNPKGFVAGRALTSETMRKLLTGYYKNKPTELARILRRLGITRSNLTRAAVANNADDDDSD